MAVYNSVTTAVNQNTSTSSASIFVANNYDHAIEVAVKKNEEDFPSARGWKHSVQVKELSLHFLQGLIPYAR